ncbi:antibiotic biosynthesis monooxygenase [Duganella sp. FT109W]|uniref:Antibiotic biosynthesis monooxygenase n=1 Tax=Duganella margarita TaxID=2692170 RepID=A0A7X4KG87_9BURK|nr:putative quinol monooxygenase [Duganella margarita]MYM73206.1 antibiotic biosynthesis monooxygenase [Duganella margarita]MYN38788.1 antibiotic biosynthesis monooxygenase [Duganella margarita]
MDATTPITIVARWLPADGAYEQVKAVIDELRPQSLAEPGCLGYQVFDSADAPRTILILEHYRDAQALEDHKQSPHYQALVVGRVLPLLAERKVEVLQARG